MANYKIQDSRKWLLNKIKELNKGDNVKITHDKGSFLVTINNQDLYRFNYIDETYSCGMMTNAFDENLEKIIKLSIKFRDMLGIVKKQNELVKGE